MDVFIDGQPITANATVAEWQNVELACTPPPGATLELRCDDGATMLQGPFLRPGDPAWRWTWNPRNVVGNVAFTLRVVRADASSSETYFTLTALPRKIDQERYAQLLADLQRVARGIALALVGGGGGARLDAASDSAPGLLEAHAALFGAQFDSFARAVERIADDPHLDRYIASTTMALEHARDFARLGDDVARGVFEPSSLHDGAALPTRITQSVGVVGPNAYENRLLKRLLTDLDRRARLIADAAERTGSRARTVAERAHAVVARLGVLRTLPFLAQVGDLRVFHGPSHIIRRDPRYREVYRFWQALRQHPLITSAEALFDLPIQELPRLYEIWCALRLVEALLNLPGGDVREQRLIAAEAHALQLTLVEDRPLLEIERPDCTLRLRYQPRYPAHPCIVDRQPDVSGALVSLDRHTRVPDLGLEIERPGVPLRVLIFDAKYRLDAHGGAPEDALADAYAYLGGVGAPDGRRAVRFALLLYPGQGELEHYASGVGALPLLPGADDHLRAWLERMLAPESI